MGLGFRTYIYVRKYERVKRSPNVYSPTLALNNEHSLYIIIYNH